MQCMVFIIYPRSLAANTLIELAASHHGCTINTIHCMYSKLPAEDEQFMYSKHVEVIIGIHLKIKCISFVLIRQM
jgi:hypothetical protein